MDTKKTNSLKKQFPMIILLSYSILDNLVNFIVNYHSKGYVSLFYILITMALFYLQTKRNTELYIFIMVMLILAIWAR